MLRSTVLILFLCLLCTTTTRLLAQQSPAADSVPALNNPAIYIYAVADKAKSIESKLDKKTTKALAQLKKQETSIIKKLQKTDSLAAKQMLENTAARYKELEEKLKSPGKLQQYIPGLDSAGTALSFIGQNPLVQQAKQYQDKAKEALSKIEALKAQLQKAENLKMFFKERKAYLKSQLEKFGFARELKKINKHAYYYAQQINEYKAILNDPKKIEKKALELLSKTKIWKEFFRKNSMLASLFRLPGGDANDPTAQASLAGLQTRAQVNNLIQTQIAAGGPNAQQQFQQNLQAAQSQLQQLKNKVLQAGGGSSDAEMPEGFKPNSQKTRNFWRRVEIGTNLQNQKGNGWLPAQSDFGLSLGYKPNDKSIIGVGGSFKLGWTQPGTRRLQLNGQGLSLRSFIDYKLGKGSFWISGGFEMNYQSEYRSIAALQDYSAWQQSGLLGVSKVVSVKSKLFKKTKLMLLWDFLSNKAIPVTQPVVFRIGYNF